MWFDHPVLQVRSNCDKEDKSSSWFNKPYIISTSKCVKGQWRKLKNTSFMHYPCPYTYISSFNEKLTLPKILDKFYMKQNSPNAHSISWPIFDINAPIGHKSQLNKHNKTMNYTVIIQSTIQNAASSLYTYDYHQFGIKYAANWLTNITNLDSST